MLNENFQRRTLWWYFVFGIAPLLSICTMFLLQNRGKFCLGIFIALRRCYVWEAICIQGTWSTAAECLNLILPGRNTYLLLLKHVCQNCMHVRCLFSDRFLLLKPPADWDASFCKFNIIRKRKLTNKSNLIREAATKHIYLFNWLKINEDPLKRKTKNAHYWDQVVVKRQKEKSNPYPICYNPQFVLGSRAAEAKGW